MKMTEIIEPDKVHPGADKESKAMRSKKTSRPALSSLLGLEFLEWCSLSSIHGVANILRTKLISFKLVWLITLTISASCSAFSNVLQIIYIKKSIKNIFIFRNNRIL